MTISERINKIIETKSIAKINFAKILNVTPAYISKIINKGAVPSDRLIDDICEKFSVNEEWLRTGNGDMFINLTRDEKISSFIDEVMKDEDDSFRKRLLSGLVALDDNGWNVLEQFLNSINERGDSI